MEETFHPLNCVLKTKKDVLHACKKLNSLGLPPHPLKVKSWDTWKIVNFIYKNAKKDSKILDVGCNGSPILPFLKKLGYTNLYGCDVDLKVRQRRLLRRIQYNFLRINPDQPINEMLENKNNFYHLSKQNLENTGYDSDFFDFISSLSVIEHGVNLDNYFKEMNRIIKNDGYLLTSTDYWPSKIETNSNIYSRPSGDKIFDQSEIEEILNIAKQNGFCLVEPMDFSFKDKVVNWKKTNKEYTFIFFCLKKSEDQK